MSYVHPINPNYVWAGPASGTAGLAGWRALVAADIPSGVGLITSVTSANGLTLTTGTLAFSSTGYVLTSGSYSNPSWLTSIAGSIVSGNIAGNAANISAATNGSLTTLSALSLPAGQVTGLAASATTDTTNASNISSGTLAAARVATLNQNTTGTAGGLATHGVNLLGARVTVNSTTFSSLGISQSLVAGTYLLFVQLCGFRTSNTTTTANQLAIRIQNTTAATTLYTVTPDTGTNAQYTGFNQTITYTLVLGSTGTIDVQAASIGSSYTAYITADTGAGAQGQTSFAWIKIA